MTDLMTRKKAHTAEQYEKVGRELKEWVGCAIAILLGVFCCLTLCGFRVL